MKRLFFALITLLLIMPIAAADSEGLFNWNIFKGVFGKTEEAQKQTEKQMGEMIERAEEFGGGANIFTIGPRCVHYSVSNIGLVRAMYGSDQLKSDLSPEELEAMVRKLEGDIREDLGNVQPTYREVIVC